jgi:putative heme-binding domain-containing protein
METAPETMRVEAINALSTWSEPSVLDRVDGRYRGLKQRDAYLLREMASGPLLNLMNHPDADLRYAAVNAIGMLMIKDASEKLFALLQTDKAPLVREAALKALSLTEAAIMDKALALATADKSKEVRIAGLKILGQMNLPGNTKASLLEKVILNQTIEEKQAAIITLAKVGEIYAAPVFEKLLDAFKNKKLPAAIELELNEALETLGNSNLLTLYNEINDELYVDNILAGYESSLFGGDEARGRRIFFQHQNAQCIRCHAYDDLGGNAGPGLNGIANKIDRKQLLEALIAPGKRLAPGYGTVTLKLKDGNIVSGIVAKEDNNSITLKIGNEPDKMITKINIEERSDALSSMPDMKNLLTKREIRDLISFLVTLDEQS